MILLSRRLICVAFDRIIEEKILEAIEKGEFDNLPGIC